MQTTKQTGETLAYKYNKYDWWLPQILGKFIIQHVGVAISLYLRVFYFYMMINTLSACILTSLDHLKTVS